MDDHHWQDGLGVMPDPSSNFGFVYEIRHLSTGKKYIGKKQYWFSSGKGKRAVKDKASPKWKQFLWRESDWRTYTSSSKDLNAAIKECGMDDFEFEILSQHSNSRDLAYFETKTLAERDALRLVDEEGEHIYYNKSIPDVKFRPPSTIKEILCESQ